MFFDRKVYSIDDIPRDQNLSDGKRRGHVNILIIDDEDFPFLDELRKHHFKITKVSDLEDIQSVSEYDVVLVDIMGVGKKLDPALQGANVIKEVKKMYPDKYLIAYSLHRTDMTINQYFNMCDDVFRKDYEIDVLKDKLDLAVQASIDPLKRWLKLRKALNDFEISSQKIARLEHLYVRRCLGKKLS